MGAFGGVDLIEAPWAIAIQLAATALLAVVGATGLLTAGRSKTVSGLLLGSAFTCLLAIPRPDTIESDLWFTLVLLTNGATGPLIVSAVLLWPPPAQPRGARMAWAAAIPVLLSGPLPAVVNQPSSTGCNNCARNVSAIVSAPDLWLLLAKLGLVSTVLWCLAAAVVLIVRLGDLPRMSRPAVGPALVAGLGISVLTVVAAVRAILAPGAQRDPGGQGGWLATCSLAVILALGIALSSLLRRLAVQRLTRRILTASPDAQTLRDSFAHLVGDPQLTFVLNPAEIRSGPGSLVVRRHGTAIAEIRFRPRFIEAADRLSDAVRSSILAIEYAAAMDALATEETALLESRQRIVRTGDETRRTVERNLHDGAQQRLVALSLQALAVERRPTTTDEVARKFHDAQRELAVGLDELRAIARGLFPAGLDVEGLVAALVEFRDHSPAPLTITVDGDPSRRPIEPLMAVFRLVVDTVTEAARPTAEVQLSLRCLPDRFEVRLNSLGSTEAAVSSATRHAADRFQALAGEVHIIAVGGDVVVEGWVPCGS